MKVEIGNYPYTLNEAHNNGLQYAFLDKNNKTRHCLARCKDYVQDVYWTEIFNKQPQSQYGFTWGVNDEPISKQQRVKYLLISDKKEDLKPYKQNILNLLSVFERKFKIPKTKIRNVSNIEHGLVIDYDNKWADSPFKISLYFFLVRFGVHYTGKATINNVLSFFKNEALNKAEPHDKSLILKLLRERKIEKILLNRIVIYNTWDDYRISMLSTVHNNSGMISSQI